MWHGKDLTPFPSGRLIVLTTRVLRASSRLRGVRGARHTRVVLIDEQPATAGLDPRQAIPLHHRAHPSVLVHENLVGITVDYEDVAEAAEAVQTASLLMRILDRVEARVST